MVDVSRRQALRRNAAARLASRGTPAPFSAGSLSEKRASSEVEALRPVLPA
jgi:hypothetical protein